MSRLETARFELVVQGPGRLVIIANDVNSKLSIMLNRQEIRDLEKTLHEAGKVMDTAPLDAGGGIAGTRGPRPD